MPTKRRGMTAVTSKEHLIVAGGVTGVFSATCISTVEVMALKSLTWSTVASLPCPYSRASGTICGDQLYMLGGWDDKSMTNLVLTCSLTELLYSHHHHHHHQYGTELLMPKLIAPLVQLSVESYWQLVDVTKSTSQQFQFTYTT